ncbi:MAG: tyrosine-type recombinase/integrase [Alphaproteobacteria bacterium]
MKLNAKQIENANREKDGAKLFDGKGLFLELHKNGSKYWRYKFRYLNKEKLMSLGVYPEITLAEAREKHRVAHKIVSEGENPIELKREAVAHKKHEQSNTFEIIARDWLEYKKTEWSEVNYSTVKRRLEQDVFPVIGYVPIKSVTHQMLIDLSKTVQERGANELAKRIIQIAKHIFQYAIINGYAEKNIAEDLKGFIKTPPTQSYAAIDPKDLPNLLKDIDRHRSRMHRQSQIALELMMLTFVRTGELIKAEWGEFDLGHKVWAIPAKRMKMNNDHLVPLSDQAIALIEELRTLHRNNHWVFPSRTRSMNHMSNNTILMALRRMGYGGIMTGHGFRSLAMTTIMERLKYPYEIPDTQLAHGKGGSVRKAYDRAKYLEQRTKMMQDWADYLDNLKHK